jgi:seryl-tRNA synthetase
MIRIDITKTKISDRQAAGFILDILELFRKEESIVSDIRFKSKAAQVKEIINLKKEREMFSNALDELVEISNRLKNSASMASDAQITKLQDEAEALISLSVIAKEDGSEKCSEK